MSNKLTHDCTKIFYFFVISYICDRLWEKVRCRAYFQNRVIGTMGLSKLSAIYKMHHSFRRQSNLL